MTPADRAALFAPDGLTISLHALAALRYVSDYIEGETPGRWGSVNSAINETMQRCLNEAADCIDRLASALEQAQQDTERLERELRHARASVAFFSSAIKSGEAWSPVCEQMRDRAFARSAAPAPDDERNTEEGG